MAAAKSKVSRVPPAGRAACVTVWEVVVLLNICHIPQHLGLWANVMSSSSRTLL